MSVCDLDFDPKVMVMGADAGDKIFKQVSLTSASMNWIHQMVKKKWAPKNFNTKSLTLKF